MPLDTDKLNAFIGKALGDLGAAFGAALVIVGDKLGLYKAMDGAGPMTPAELAAKTGTSERYIREWLSAQAAAGYVDYDPATEKFTMTEEQAFVLANSDSPVFMPGAYELVTASIHDEPKITEAFKSGKGVGWHEHHACLFRG